MRNIRITIEYNGSQFYGWQKQTGKRTVQGELEEAIFKLTNENVILEGSGRTDKGVHALGQVANFHLGCKIPIQNLKKALNNLLPEDIRIKKAEKVDENFHARFSAKRKTYQYVVQIGGQVSAISHALLAVYPYEVDFEKLQTGAKLLIGKHNFKAFCCADTQVTNFTREIYDLSIRKKSRKIFFEVTGNGFLYNMVRILVGTLLDFGSGKLSEDDIKSALQTGQRKFAGKTMPANGLYLKKVSYC